MEACEESEDLTVTIADQKQAVSDGASVTVDLVGFLREQEEVKLSQQIAGGETVQKGFAIRELPFLIAGKNHHRATEKEVATDGGAKKHHDLESGKDDGDEVGDSAVKGFAVRELAFLIAQKHHHAGGFHGDRKQQALESPRSDDCDDVGDGGETRAKGIEVQELALLVAEKKTHGSHISGDGKKHGFESQGIRDVEVGELAGQLRIDVPGIATSPTIVIEGDNEVGEKEHVNSPDDEGGGAVVPPQSDLIATKEELVGFDGVEMKEDLPTTAEVKGLDKNGGVGERSNGEGLQITAAEEEHRLIPMKVPEVEDGSGGEDDDDDPTRLKVVTAAIADSNNFGMLTSDEGKGNGIHNVPAHFPFKILSTSQRRGGVGEASQQVFLPRSNEQEQVGDRNDPPGLSNGDNKNAEEDVERTTPRHPRWTREETSVLLAAKRQRDEEIKSLVGSKIASCSAMRRWDSISAYCKSHGVFRDVHQCRKRWSNLAADFKKIRNWQKLGGGADGPESYWAMKGDSRRKNKLPGSFDPQMFADMDFASDSNPHKKRKLVLPEDAAPTDDSHRGGGGSRDPLASVLESSGRAMQAALVRSIQTQIEVSNQNSELDRNQRKEQSDNLVAVLGMLAESLAKIAQRL